MKLTIELDSKEAIKAIQDDLNKKYLVPPFNQARVRLEPIIKQLCYNAIIESPEYQAITPGSILYHALGIPDIQDRMQIVIEEILNNIQVKQKISLESSGFLATFTVNILKGDYSDILGLPEATFEYYSKKQNTNITLPWLEWLLIDGAGPIVTGYHFTYSKRGPSSRTGQGFMFKNGDWSIDPIFAGTPRNNFLTRSLEAIEYELAQVIEEEFVNAYKANPSY